MDIEDEKRRKRTEYQRRWIARPGNRKKQMENIRRYMGTKKGRAAQLAANKKWQRLNTAAHKEYMLSTNRKIKFGVSREEVDAMVRDQLGSCKICAKHFPPGGKFSVDHCHESGRIRGLLCQGCNTGLGHFRDSVPALEAAIAYLKRI